MPRVLGFFAGAVIGGAGRFVVTFVWALAVVSPDPHNTELVVSLISAAIGLAVGGIAGATCRPIFASCIGAGLSGCSCLLGWLPIHLVPTGHMSEEARRAWIDSYGLYWFAFIAMIAVGAIAGGGGAWFGARSRASQTGQRAAELVAAECQGPSNG